MASATLLPITPAVESSAADLSEVKTVIASAVVDSAKHLGKGVPTKATLAQAITAVNPESHMAGASALKITIDDLGFQLTDSGFFTGDDKHGRLDPIDVNYPKDTRYWWRLTQLSPQSDGTITMTFMDRLAALLMAATGPVKANRGATTRAEFLKSLVTRSQSGVEFHSHQLDKKQPVTPVSSSSTSPSAGSGAKSPGIGAGSKGLTVKSQPMSSTQRDVANTILAGCAKHNAPEVVMVAAIYAGIGESDLSPSNTFGRTTQPGTSTADQIEAWLTGGPDFTGHGGLVAAGQYKQAWQIANDVERNAVWDSASNHNSQADADSYYNQSGGSAFLGEAERIVQAGGGGGAGGTIETINPYNFQVGSNSNQHESYWAAMLRLAQEVNWALFVDGNRVYYDSQMTLIRQKPVAAFKRNHKAVIDWNYDWDTRHIATQMTMHLVCDPFEFHAGEVFLLKPPWGPCADMSSAGLPGRWLISDVVRTIGDPFSEFTLVQPQRPKREPAPSTSSKSVPGASGSTSGAVTLRGGATNPAPGATWGRLDQGFDGNYGPAGAVAPFDGTIEGIGITGWPGQGRYFVVRNDDQSGPDYTRAMYFAEGATPLYPNGTHVKAGQKVGNPVAVGGNNSPGNFEIGPASTSGYGTLAAAYGKGSAAARSMVMAYYNWMRSLGAGATSDPSAAGSA